MEGKFGRGVLVALVGVVIGLGVHEVAARSPSAATRTLTIVSKNDDVRVVDLAPPGPTHGDLRVFNAPLYNQHATKVIGRLDGFCTVTDPANEPTEEHHFAQCLTTFSLPDGEITVQGVNRRPALTVLPITPGRYAITGGTEQYQRARGELQYEAQGEDFFRYTFQLLLEP